MLDANAANAEDAKGMSPAVNLIENVNALTPATTTSATADVSREDTPTKGGSDADKPIALVEGSHQRSPSDKVHPAAAT